MRCPYCGGKNHATTTRIDSWEVQKKYARGAVTDVSSYWCRWCQRYVLEKTVVEEHIMPVCPARG